MIKLYNTLLSLINSNKSSLDSKDSELESTLSNLINNYSDLISFLGYQFLTYDLKINPNKYSSYIYQSTITYTVTYTDETISLFKWSFYNSDNDSSGYEIYYSYLIHVSFSSDNFSDMLFEAIRPNCTAGMTVFYYPDDLNCLAHTYENYSTSNGYPCICLINTSEVNKGGATYYIKELKLLCGSSTNVTVTVYRKFHDTWGLTSCYPI